jgi:hypothetical protein
VLHHSMSISGNATRCSWCRSTEPSSRTTEFIRVHSIRGRRRQGSTPGVDIQTSSSSRIKHQERQFRFAPRATDLGTITQTQPSCPECNGTASQPDASWRKAFLAPRRELSPAGATDAALGLTPSRRPIIHASEPCRAKSGSKLMILAYG